MLNLTGPTVTDGSFNFGATVSSFSESDIGNYICTLPPTKLLTISTRFVFHDDYKDLFVYALLFSLTYMPLFVHNTCSTMHRLWTLEREGIVLNMLPNMT